LSIRTKAAAKSGITVKVIGSLAVVGTAAAVAGMGTFGSFTDSTTAVDATTDTGVLDIALGVAANYATVPAITGGLIPGDYRATPFDLRNAGTVDWSAVNFKAAATRSSALDTDTVNGLQLTVESCSVAWVVAGPGTYSCPGEVTDFYAGPIVMDEPLQGAASLTAGGVDHLLATIAFPADATDALQGQRSDLAFTFTAMQRDGAAR
jgi:hypothetical protein